MVILEGRRALVTGGTRGLGLAVVRELASLGAEVTFTGTTQGSLEAARRQLDGDARGIVADMRDRDAMKAIGSEGWDVLVNNASVGGPLAVIHEADETAWLDTLDINLGAVVSLCHAVLPGMLKRGGTIVNISTGAAHRPIPKSSAYCVSKAGLAMLTQMLHAEYGARGLRVFGFGPGVMKTDMHMEVRTHYEGVFPPLDEVDGPETAARIVAWLCTDGADRFAGREIGILDEELRAAAGVSST